MRNLLLLFAVLACYGCVCLGSLRIDPAMFDAFPNGDKRVLSQLTTNDILQREKYVEPSPLTACPTIPAPPAASDVNNLHPGNIDVVMSMGDSITAAMSAKDILITNLKEYRGISYAIGGDAGVVTMANLLKQYSPNLIGQSTGIGLRTSNGTGLNGAVSGALNVDMRGQAEFLVDRLKGNSKVDMQKSWKVLTIWIGSNNLCAVCKNNLANNADDYEKHVTDALEYFYAHVPRLFVNLVSNLDVSKLNGFTSGTCGTLHIYECQCTTSNAALVASTTKEYQARSYKIANAFNSRKNPEFAVVVQPFLTETVIFNRTYLSTADCFHPSALCHTALSTALWNSMITPVPQKQKAFIQDEQPLCATSSSLLYTK